MGWGTETEEAGEQSPDCSWSHVLDKDPGFYLQASESRWRVSSNIEAMC